MGTLVGIAVCIGKKRAVATAPSEVEPTGIMTFADPAVQALCAKTWGDGTNITYEQAREVTEIPKNWAKDNKTITSFNEIKYFKNLLYIRERAFTNCSNLVINEISLPNVLLIELSAFANCTALGCELLNLPSCETLGTTVFYNTAIKRVVMPKLKTIADSYTGYGCFQKIPNLESVTLRDIEYIGDYSFSDDKKLVLDSIEYPNLTRIGQAAFANCTLTLNKAILPNCKKIESSAFYGCSSMALTKLELPQCTIIGIEAFNGCSSMALTSLELPQCTSIGASAFNGCSSMALTKLELPQCTSIGASAFNGCSSMALTSLELPQCTSIRESAFNGCSSMALTKLELPQCTAIGGSAFKGCSSMALTKLELPLCTSIGGSAFNGCPLLSEITFQNVTSVGTQAFIGSTIAKIKLPSVETMAASSNYDGIFSYCKNLVLVDLGENCSSIGNESLGRYVGTSGNNITIICRASTPPSLGGTIINKGSVYATIGEIYVPDESVEAYKTATNWSAYANIILPLSQYKG